MRAVDTNVLVRLMPKPGGSSSAVYERDPATIGMAVEMLLNHEHLTLQDADAVAAAIEHFRRRPALGFPDCLVLEIARKAGHLPLGTFDRNLAKLDDAEGLVSRSVPPRFRKHGFLPESRVRESNDLRRLDGSVSITPGAPPAPAVDLMGEVTPFHRLSLNWRTRIPA